MKTEEKVLIEKLEKVFKVKAEENKTEALKDPKYRNGLEMVE